MGVLRLGAVLAVVAALVGCVLASPSLAAEAIPIGVLLTQSPPGSVIQGTEVLHGLRIQQQFLNQQGGVLGRPLELLVEDTSGLPEKGRSGAEKLITQSRVLAITGEHQSSVALAEIEVVHRYRVPYVNVNAWSDAVRQRGYEEVFNPGPWNSLVSEAMAYVIRDMGVRRVVAFAENTDYGIGQADILREKLRQLAPSVQYSYQVLDRTASDFLPALVPLRRNPPDMVVTIMLPPAGYLLMNQLYEQGVAPSGRTWLFDGAGISDYPDFWDNVTEAGRYLIALGFYHPEMRLTEMGRRVRDAYVQRTGNNPSRLVFQAADALWVLADAIRRAGRADREAVIQALKTTRVEGTRGVITFHPEKGNTYQQWLDIPYVVYQYTQVRQKLEDTRLVVGPGVSLDVARLQRPR